jgi:hypothetical protein
MITRLAATALTALVLALGGSAAARADVSTTQHLPSAACNAGTMNAHESAPEATGNGAPIFAHGAIPGTGNVTPCGHGG